MGINDTVVPSPGMAYTTASSRPSYQSLSVATEVKIWRW